MGQFKQNFSGGSCITNMFRLWLFIKHQAVPEFTRISVPKIRPGHNRHICMAAFFQKSCTGKLYLPWWWYTTKKL